MESSILTQVLLPAALALLMFGMGLSLTTDDFKRLWRFPKPVLAGLFGQILILPILAFLIASALDLRADLAIGLMIVAACPGGTMSNVLSHLCRANLALSITLTAIGTVLCILTTPLIIKFAIVQFSEQGLDNISLTQTALGIMFVTLMPVLLGLVVKHKWNDFAQKCEDFFRRFSMLFMIGMIIAILIQEHELLVASFQQMFFGALLLNLGAITTGIVLSKIFNLNITDTFTLGIEVGIQNASMAMLIAVSFLNQSAWALSPGVYGLTMYIGVALLVLYARKLQKTQSPPANTSNTTS